MAKKKKYKFRKMFFVCEDKKVIASNVQTTDAHQARHTAEAICRQRQTRAIDETLKVWHPKGKAAATYTVEEFYLVPAALYDQVIKPWVDDDEPKTGA